MDPDTALAEARKAASEVCAVLDSDDQDESDLRYSAGTLAERFRALDEQLSRGGFLPADWQR